MAHLEVEIERPGAGVQPPAAQGPNAPQKPNYNDFKATYVNHHNSIHGTLSNADNWIDASPGVTHALRTLQNRFHRLDPAGQIPIESIKKSADVKAATKKDHADNMKAVDKLITKIGELPDGAQKDDQLRKANEIKEQMLAMNEATQQFIDQKMAYLEHQAVDQNARSSILGAYNENKTVTKDGKESSNPRNPPETWQDLMNKANTEDGVSFNYKGSELSLKKGADGKIEIRHKDPAVVAETAAALGKTSVEILPGTSRSQAVGIIKECQKRGITVTNAQKYANDANKALKEGKKFDGELNFLQRGFTREQRGAPSTGSIKGDLQRFVGLHQSRAPAHLQAQLNAAANASARANDNIPNSVFSDRDPPTKAIDRIAESFISLMANGGEVAEAKEMLDLSSKSPQQITEFVETVEHMTRDDDRLADNMIRTPDGQKDIQDFVLKDVLGEGTKKCGDVADLLEANGTLRADIAPRGPAAEEGQDLGMN